VPKIELCVRGKHYILDSQTTWQCHEHCVRLLCQNRWRKTAWSDKIRLLHCLLKVNWLLT